jgi:hypothetical protein
MLLSVGGVAVIGVAVIVVTMAAGVFMSAETESGVLANGAAQVTDASASGGKAIQFGAASPSPSPTPTGAPCTSSGFGVCGPYSYPAITPSNGYNTYVANQDGACGGDTTGKYCGAQNLVSYGPGNWSLTATMPAGYDGVRSYPDIGQLFNNWGTGGFNGGSDMPVSGVSAISSTYAETMNENSGTYAEAAYDIWTSTNEVMVWVDTTPLRGSGGAVEKGTGTLGGIPFTYYVYSDGNPADAPLPNH